MDVSLRARWCRHLDESAMQSGLRNGGARYAFGLGLPDPALFPVGQVTAAAERVLSRAGYSALQYAPPSQLLREQVCAIMRLRGVNATPRQVLLTTGGQQGLSILTALLLQHRGRVLLEDLTYPGFTQAIRRYEPHLLSVASHTQSGIDIDHLEYQLTRASRPSLLYMVSDGHNPLGITLSHEARTKLAALGRRYRIPIINDDPYGLLNYTQAHPASLAAYDSEYVFYVGSFSKILSPSLRVGWLIVPESLIPPLSVIKESNDINMAPFSQHVVAELLMTFDLATHLQHLRSTYKAKRDVMISALAASFPSGTHWAVPTNGFFIFVTLPASVDALELHRQALECDRVSFMTGSSFRSKADTPSPNSMRMAFAFESLEGISAGVAELGALARQVSSDEYQICSG